MRASSSPTRRRSWRPLDRAAAVLVPGLVGAALLILAGGLLPGCARDVTFGPAGEPEGARQPVWLRFTVETDPAHAAWAQAFVDQFAPLGVRARVEVRNRGEVARRALAGESDACLLGWSGVSPDPLGLVSAKLTPSGVENFSGYDNPEVALLLSGLFTNRTQAEKEALVQALQEFLYEEAPWVYGVAVPLHDASAAALTGWRPGPAGAVYLRDASLSSGAGRIVVGLGLGVCPDLDPLRPIDPQAGTLFRCLFDALVTLGPDGKLLPELAESWEFSTNARRLTVKLRPQVTFHNGASLRPDDVVFTYQQVLPGRLPDPGIVKVRAGEGGTVVFDFAGPFPNFLELFGLQPIVPATYYRTVGPAGFAAAPVGTGPFRLDPARRQRQLVLDRWDGYYGGCPDTGPGHPALLKEVVFSFVPDPDRRVAMLQKEDIALAPALFPREAQTLRTASGATVVREPGWTVLALELDTGRPPFDDTRVRLALNLAVDRPALAETLGPEATVLPTAVLPEGFGFSADAGAFARDLERARSLLYEAGYLVSSPD